MGGARAAAAAAAIGLLVSCHQSVLTPSDAPARVAGADLGTFPLGTTARGSLSVASLGADDIEVSTVALPTNSPAGLVLQVVGPLQVASGTTVAVPVTFTPQTAGTFDVPVTVALTPGGAQVAHVTAHAISVQLGASPQPLDFGAVSLRTTATRQLEIDNPSPIAVTAVVSLSGAASFAVGGGAATVAVPAQGSATLAVTFTPELLGPAQATLQLAPCAGCAATPVPAKGTGVASVVSVSPASLDLGNVHLGQSVQKTVTISNAGNVPLALGGVSISAGEPPFSVSPSGAASVPAAGSLDLAVTFAPTAAGAFQGNLQIQTADPASPVVDVPLTGASGVAAIAVLPPALDFGAVPANATVTEAILIQNVGDAAPGVSPLTVSSVTVTGPGFSIQPPPANQQLAAGQTITVPVIWASGTPGTASGEVDVASDDPLTPLVRVPLAGTSRTVAPCAWSATPSQVDFGLLQPGQQATLSFALENVGTDECLIGNLQTTGAPFSLTGPPPPQLLLQPGDMYDLGVIYAPTRLGVDTGDVTFSASNAAAGQVPLLGASAKGCLAIAPTDLSFGDASASCPALVQTVTLSNSCSEPVTVDSISIGRGINPAAFVFQPVPLPEVLPPGGSSALSVSYEPAPSEPDGNPDNAALLVDDGEGTPRTVGLTGVAMQNPSATDSFSQQAAPKVDVLIVMDNSASFETQQQGVQQNVNAFMGAALAAGIDFHVGVTTTGIEPATGSWTTCPGGANGGEAGRLFPVDDSSPRILTPQTPNLYQAFDDDVNVGVCHWDERPFDAAVDALTPPLSTSAKAPGTPWPADGNLGFLRQDALLQIIFIQDDDDESVVPAGYTTQSWVDHYVQILEGLKGPGNEWMITASAVTAVPGCNNPQDLGVRYFQLVSEMGGQILSVCTTDWGATMGQLGSQAFSLRLRFPLSKKPASPSQITVTMNGQPVPSSDPQSGNVEWSYDSATGELVFSPGYAPPAGAQIQVSYPVACP